MIKGFTFTLGALAALVLVFVGLIVLGGALPESKTKKQKIAVEVLAGYELSISTLRQQIKQTGSYQERTRLRPGIDAIYANWEKDREKCAEVMPHDQIYGIDEQLQDLYKLVR